MEYVFIGSVILIAWILGHISSQISLQINVISEATMLLRDASKKEGSAEYSDWGSEICSLINTLPSDMAKEIKHELGYISIKEYRRLSDDLKDIRDYLNSINSNISDIEIKIKG